MDGNTLFYFLAFVKQIIITVYKMKKIILALLLVTNSVIIFGADYTKVDKLAADAPNNLKSVDEISVRLTKGLTSPAEKARAIYYWISHNIRYNIKLYESNKSITSTDDLISETLKSYQGVCANYAELFNACSKATGIESYVISGYTKIDGKVADIGHAWNAIRVDGKFWLIDATWASGHQENTKYVHQFDDRYFMITPDEFIKTHMPFDPIWQFLNNPLNNKEFESNDFSKLKIASNYNFNDSIKVQSELNQLDKLIRENKRISKCGTTNNLVRESMSYNQLNITNLKHNLSITTYNQSVELFNSYIMAKNKQFNGLSMTDDEVIDLLANTNKKLDEAEKINQFLNSDNADLNKNIEQMSTSIKDLRNNLKTEDAFMQKYLKTWKPFRIFLFYR